MSESGSGGQIDGRRGRTDDTAGALARAAEPAAARVLQIWPSVLSQVAGADLEVVCCGDVNVGQGRL